MKFKFDPDNLPKIGQLCFFSDNLEDEIKKTTIGVLYAFKKIEVMEHLTEKEVYYLFWKRSNFSNNYSTNDYKYAIPVYTFLDEKGFLIRDDSPAGFLDEEIYEVKKGYCVYCKKLLHLKSCHSCTPYSERDKK